MPILIKKKKNLFLLSYKYGLEAQQEILGSVTNDDFAAEALQESYNSEIHLRMLKSHMQ